jgi:hypothetical protein
LARIMPRHFEFPRVVEVMRREPALQRPQEPYARRQEAGRLKTSVRDGEIAAAARDRSAAR